MANPLTKQVLEDESRIYRNSGGVSENCADSGFAPAFLDTSNGTIYRSTFAGGRPAPCHCLDGLPSTCIIQRDETGHAVAAHPSIRSGFVRDNVFFTREEAARAVQDDPRPKAPRKTLSSCHRLVNAESDETPLANVFLGCMVDTGYQTWRLAWLGMCLPWQLVWARTCVVLVHLDES